MNIRSLLPLALALVVGITATIAPTPCSAQVQIFTVGPDGQYATVSAALADLLAAPYGNNRIRIEAGVTTLENISLPASWTTGNIWISGGWDASFVNQSGDPADTVISGPTSGRVIDVAMAGGSLFLSDLSIRNGASVSGAGIRINPTNDCSVRLDNLRISNNTASGTGSVMGGGLSASLTDTTRLDIDGCEIDGNFSTGTVAGAESFGAGMTIEAAVSSEFSVIRSSIHDNTATSETQVGGAGIYVSLTDNATGAIADCVIEDNIVSSTVPISVSGAGLRGGTAGSAQLTVERTRVFSNTSSIGGVYHQVIILAHGDSVVSISDSIVADGGSDGLYVSASDQSTAYLTNLTVAANGNDGIRLNRSAAGTADMYLSNSISAINGGLDLSVNSGSITQTANIIGVEPEFVDWQDLDFRVEVGSIAEDAGVPAPPGGLGTGDVRGGIRFLGAAPDAGAYEGNVSLIFSDGFDVAFTGRWSEVVGALIR